MRLTLVFSQGKPCCKNKASKGKVSCKVNQANIEVKNDGVIIDKGTQRTGNAGVQCPNNPGCICSNSIVTNSTDPKKCASCANVKWWKFWVKKKNCCSRNA